MDAGNDLDLQAIARHARDGMKAREGRLAGRRVWYFPGKRLVAFLVQSDQHGLDTVTDEEAATNLAERLLHGASSSGNRFFIPAAKCNLAQVPLLEHRNNISGSQNSSRFIGKGEYYVWLTEASKTWARLGLASVIVLTLAAVMHPVWPLWMKLGVWWISVIILALGLGFMILRSSAALILWLVGVEFWILPNIFLDEFDSVRELITPLYLCERNRKPNGWARATVAILLGCVSVFIFVHFDALVTLSSYDEAEFLEDTPELDIMDEMAAELEREEAEANAGAHESEM